MRLAKAAGFPEALVRGMWRGSPAEKGPRSGTRKAIKDFTRVSRNRLKPAKCADWMSLCTLTYPGSFPMDGRACKKHFHLLLTHLRSDRA